MTNENETPPADGAAGRGKADRFGDHQNNIRYTLERRDRPNRERLVALLDGKVIGHARLLDGRWHTFANGEHNIFITLGKAVLALRDAIIAGAAR